MQPRWAALLLHPEKKREHTEQACLLKPQPFHLDEIIYLLLSWFTCFLKAPSTKWYIAFLFRTLLLSSYLLFPYATICELFGPIGNSVFYRIFTAKFLYMCIIYMYYSCNVCMLHMTFRGQRLISGVFICLFVCLFWGRISLWNWSLLMARMVELGSVCRAGCICPPVSVFVDSRHSNQYIP